MKYCVLIAIGVFCTFENVLKKIHRKIIVHFEFQGQIFFLLLNRIPVLTRIKKSQRNHGLQKKLRSLE